MRKVVLFLLILFGLAYSQPGGLYPHSIHCWHFTQGAIDCIIDSVNANLDTTRYATIDTVIVIVRDSIADIYPIPHDSLDTDTSWVIPGDGLGGGSAVEIGDTITHVVNVDGVTTTIVDDTVRADTVSSVATHTRVDSVAEYYYWRSKSRYRFPEWDDMVLWNWNDFRTSQDSVTICYFKDPTTYYNYMQAERAAGAADSHYVFPSFDFVAPRDVSDIADTLFIIRYKTTSADTLNVGVKPMIYEGTTARYIQTDIVASTSWTTMTVRKSYGTLSSIVEGDEFSLILYCKLDGDSLWVGRIEERWY
jgi:hypothetical protein